MKHILCKIDNVTVIKCHNAGKCHFVISICRMAVIMVTIKGFVDCKLTV